MTKIALEIATTVYYDDVESARAAGQAVEIIIGKTKNAVRLREVPGQRTIPLYPAPLNLSQVTRGGQEIEGRISSLVKNLRNAIPELVDVDFTDEVKVLEGRQWTVDYQRLLDNVSEHVDRAAVLPVFREAVALTLQNESLRGVK